MFKKSFIFLSVSAAFFAHAQDVSGIRNSVEVYNSSSLDGSSKYNAMTGSMGALGGEASVLNSNPAGIGVSIAGDISGTIAVKGTESTSTLGNSSYTDKVTNTDLGNVGGIIVFDTGNTSPWKFVNIGINYSNKNLDDYSETPASNQITYDIGSGADMDVARFGGHAYNRSGDLSKMSLGLGGNYNNRIYVGAGLNFHGVSLQQYDTARIIFDSDNHSEVLNKQYTPYWEDGTGFSASVGVIGKVNNQFRLGAAIETPTWWNIKRVYTYYDAEDAAYDGEFSETQKYSSPLKATLSAAFVPNKNFAVNVDYSLGLSKPKFNTEDVALETELNDFYSDNYRGMSEIKIGAEYRIEQFRLRGGYGLATSPFDSLSMSAISADGSTSNLSSDHFYVGKRNTIGAGIGYDFRSFFIDAAYQNVSSEYKSPFMSGSAAAGSQYYSNNTIIASEASIVSDVKNKQNNFFVTLGWKF